MNNRIPLQLFALEVSDRVLNEPFDQEREIDVDEVLCTDKVINPVSNLSASISGTPKHCRRESK